MTTLIIPDIHNKTARAQKIIDENPTDRRVFLGDIYDDFGDSLQDIRETAKWHQKALADESNVFLMGNHDMFYRWPTVPQLRCSGNDYDKQVVINSVLTRQDWNKMRFFCYVDDFLLTHAGLHKSFLAKADVPLPRLAYLLRDAETELISGRVMPIFQAGYQRGGDLPFGGIIWLDWAEFAPVDGLKQIVGHTPDVKIRQKDGNWCLDTHLRHAAVVDKGKIEIFAT